VDEAKSAGGGGLFLVGLCSGTDALVQGGSLALPSLPGASWVNAPEGCSNGFSGVVADAVCSSFEPFSQSAVVPCRKVSVDLDETVERSGRSEVEGQRAGPTKTLSFGWRYGFCVPINTVLILSSMIVFS
jgi:hypothetical protein